MKNEHNGLNTSVGLNDYYVCTIARRKDRPKMGNLKANNKANNNRSKKREQKRNFYALKKS